jgi:phosphoglycolate phosphatase
MIRLMMFDLDGTLVDSAPDIAASVNDVLRWESLPELDLATIRTWIGHGARQTLASAYVCSVGERTDSRDPPAPDGSLLDRLMDAYRAFHDDHCGKRSTVYPGVDEVLRRLQELSVTLAVVTNKEEYFARQLLGRLGLDRWFATVVGGDTLPCRKPDPAPLRHCLAQHGVHSRDALMIGDSVIDLRAARAAGTPFCFAAHGYGEPALACEADAALKSFAELVDVLHAATTPVPPCHGCTTV